MHYYAFYNSCGVGTRYARDLSRVGYLRIFESRSARDAWVDNEMWDGVWDGNIHREALTAREAMPYLVRLACRVTFETPGEVRARGVCWMVDEIESDRAFYGADWEALA